MAGEELGTLRFDTAVDSSGALTELAAMLAEARAMLSTLDGEEAVVNIRTNIRDLERAQRQYRELINLKKQELATGGRGGGPVADDRRIKKLRREIELLSLASSDLANTQKTAKSALDRVTGATEKRIQKEERLRRLTEEREKSERRLATSMWKT